MSPQWRRRIIIAAVLAVAYIVARNLQQELGINFTLEGLEQFRQWVQGLGWLGPGVFILLIVFRLFIGLSSHLVLVLGGLTFGPLGGILWGSVGLVASSLVLFYLARLLGADWAERRFGDQYTALMDRVNRVGALAIFTITAHPVGLLTPAHLAAGLVGIGFPAFTVAVSLAAPIRTAPYVLLGAAALDLSLQQSLMIAAGLLLVFVAPLAIPGVRHWVRGENGE